MANDPIRNPRKKINISYDFTFDDGKAIQKENQPFLVDLVTLEKLFFQGLPDELDITPDAGWVAVAAPGRNNANYQFTGGEDTILINLSFYGNDETRQDVWRKVKWLTSLTRNDGYLKKPHHVSLNWGTLFRASKFIVWSVLPKVGLFDRRFGMMPQLARVELTLKKVTENNSTRNEILQIDT